MSLEVFWNIQGYCLLAITIVMLIWALAGAVHSISDTYYSIKIKHAKLKAIEKLNSPEWEPVESQKYTDNSKDA